MKYIGALIVLGYAGLTLAGYEPFTSQERGRLPTDARRSPGGILFWHTGVFGGK